MKPLLLAAALVALPPPLVPGAAASTAAAPADIIVTARLETRQPTSLRTPSFGVGITADELAAVNALNTEDLLRYAPATIVRKRYAGDPNATLSFRNMHSQQTPRALVMVDGFTISNFLGADWDTSPKWGVLAPDDIARIEIIYGPTSARYSGNSMGGTMLIETRPIERSTLRLDVQTFGQHYHYYDTSEDLLGWSVDTGLDLTLGSRGGLSIGWRHFRNAGQPMEWRMVTAGTAFAGQAITDRQLPFLHVAAQDSVVETTQDQLRLRGEYALGDNWQLHGLAALLLARDDMLQPKSFLRDANGAPTFVGIAGVTAGAAQRSELLGGLGLAGRVGDWDVKLNFSRFDTLRNKTETSDNFDLLTGVEPSSGLAGNADASWQNWDGMAEHRAGIHTLALGLSLARYHVANQTWLSPDWATGSHSALRDAAGGRTRLLGFFAEDALHFTPRLTATLGLRFESWRASAGSLVNAGTTVRYAPRRESAWSPKLALSFAPDRDSRFTASVALATRFPTVRELYQPGLIQYGANVGALDLNGFNPNLKPEKALDVQLTAMHRFGQWHLTLDAYRQDVRDTIFAQTIAVPDPQSGNLIESSLLTNIGKVRSWGADLVISAEDVFVDGLSLDANLSWISAEISRNPLNPALVGNHFPRIPTWRANASLRYAPTPRTRFALNFRHQSTPDRNIENDATSKCSTFFCVSAFSFVDLKATQRLGAFELSLGIDNLFNEKAFVYHPYPARSFLLGLRWKGDL